MPGPQRARASMRGGRGRRNGRASGGARRPGHGDRVRRHAHAWPERSQRYPGADRQAAQQVGWSSAPTSAMTAQATAAVSISRTSSRIVFAGLQSGLPDLALEFRRTRAGRVLCNPSSSQELVRRSDGRRTRACPSSVSSAQVRINPTCVVKPAGDTCGDRTYARCRANFGSGAPAHTESVQVKSSLRNGVARMRLPVA